MLKCFNQASNILLSSGPIGHIDKDNSSRPNDQNLSDNFRNKSFYLEIENHNGSDCCFNDIIGLPLKMIENTHYLTMRN
jgi:hypothetical protein